MAKGIAGRLIDKMPKPQWGVGLLLFVLGIYVLTMSGHTYSPDEETMLETSRALVERGTWAMPASGSMVQVEGIDGQRYSQYGPGQSLAAVPWVAVGRGIARFFPSDQAGYPLRLVLGTYNALIAAGIVALFGALGVALGYSRRAGLAGALALGFCTFLWPHSRTFFSEPLTGLALLGSFYLLVKLRITNYELQVPVTSSQELKGPLSATSRPSAFVIYALASGALFALVVATKVQYVVTLPAFVLFLGWTTVQGSKFKVKESRDAENPSSIVHRPSSVLVPALWVIGLLVGLLPLFWYNWAIFGSPFSTGYGANPTTTLTNAWLEGVYGLLLSPGKGVVWFALPLVLALCGWIGFTRKHKAEALFVAVLVVPVILLFSLYSFWHGDGAWGPRYLIPVLPFLMLGILPVLEDRRQATDGSSYGLRITNYEGNEKSEIEDADEQERQLIVGRPSSVVHRLIVSVVLGIGFLVSTLGAFINFDTYINVVEDLNIRHWTIEGSPIGGHLRLFEQRVEEWSVRVAPGAGTTVFLSGFSYSEGDKAKGEALPRWTTGSGVMRIQMENDVRPEGRVTLRLADHRPPELSRANVVILVDGRAVETTKTPAEGVSTDYSFNIPNRPVRVTIQSDTWNPSSLQDGARNEEIGVRLESVAVEQEGRALSNRLVEGIAAPPYYPQPRWYYDPGTHHFADIWPVYMAETGMGRKTMLLLGLLVLVIGLALAASGWRGLRYGRD